MTQQKFWTFYVQVTFKVKDVWCKSERRDETVATLPIYLRSRWVYLFMCVWTKLSFFHIALRNVHALSSEPSAREGFSVFGGLFYDLPWCRYLVRCFRSSSHNVLGNSQFIVNCKSAATDSLHSLSVVYTVLAFINCGLVTPVYCDWKLDVWSSCPVCAIPVAPGIDFLV